MADDAQALVLAELERAELAARERRLAAAAEADAIVTGATNAAAEIERSADDRVAAAVAALRSEHLARAERQIAALAEELGELEGRPARLVRDRRFGEAVDTIVAAVLGEEVPPARPPGSEREDVTVAAGMTAPALGLGT